MEVSGSEGLTRRQLVGGATATATAAALGATPTLAARRAPDADVVIVGGGLSGLAAAYTVMKSGRTPLVLEARPRVGGRTLNHPIGGGKVIEAGGEWVGPTQDRVHAYLGELGLSIFPEYIDGKHIYAFDGARMTYTEDGPTGTAPPDPVVLPDTLQIVARLDEMSQSVPVDAPWAPPQAAEWDAQTLETWLRENTATERFRKLARFAVRSILGAEPSEMSLLFALFVIAAAGNEQNPGTFERLFSTRNGSNEDRVHGGSADRARALPQARRARQARSAGAADRPVEQRRARVRRRAERDRTAGDRRRPARARRPDPVRAAASRQARPADPPRAAGHPAQVRGDLPAPLLARRRLQRLRDHRPRARPGGVRQQSARRRAGRARQLRVR